MTGFSNTGKSHIRECIDFVLAGQPPRQFPESRGYATVALQLSVADGSIVTVIRSLLPSELDHALVFPGPLAEWDGEAGERLPVSISASKESVQTLSGWLLAASGFEPNTRIVKNQRGASQSLSFRNVAPLVLVGEEEMISESSPVEPSAYTQRTSARSAFNVLVTGEAPTAAQLAELAKAHSSRDQAAQYVALLDGLIDELRRELEEEHLDRHALETELARIDDELAAVSELVSESGARVRSLIDERNAALYVADRARHEASAADELASRFAVLGKHYEVDLRRLEFAMESGHFFDQIAASHCPRCGRPLDRDEYCHEEAVEFSTIEQAARVEIKKLQPRIADLAEAHADATRNADRALRENESALTRARELDDEIRAVANPTAESARARVHEIAARRRVIEDSLTRFRELDRYAKLREEAWAESQRKVDRSRVEHDVSSMRRLADRVRDLLLAWRFPLRSDVLFDLQIYDLVIDGKPRNANGKGVRAVTHAAFTIGLMHHCMTEETPHPGFVVLDTPLTPFRGETDDLEDLALTRDLHAAFLHTLAHDGVGQTIVLENVDPPPGLFGEATVHIFSGPEGAGRRGLYPVG